MSCSPLLILDFNLQAYSHLSQYIKRVPVSGLYTEYHRMRMVTKKDFAILDYRTLLNLVHFNNMFYLCLDLQSSLYTSHFTIKIL
jgi:hypothetical protein